MKSSPQNQKWKRTSALLLNIPGIQEAVLLPAINSFCLPKVYTDKSSSNAGYHVGTWAWWSWSISEVYLTQNSVSWSKETTRVSNFESSQEHYSRLRELQLMYKAMPFKITCRLYWFYFYWTYCGVWLATKHITKISV